MLYSLRLKKRRFLGRSGQRGVALIVVLSLVVIVSLILVAFVSVMSLDRSASAGYGQSLAAEQIGQGALNLVVADLQNEMGKDAAPDLTVTSRPIYTNVTAANILPQPVGTNSAMPNLIKISTATNSYTGSVRNGSLMASSDSTANPSKNGRYLDATRWSAPYLGTFPNATSVPNWIVMTRGGAVSSGSFGSTGNTLNNPALSNTNYAIGRFAYAIYDVGGLLDITAAGHPTTLTAAQINQLKGTLAGADLSVVGVRDVDALVNWRNATSAGSVATYLSHITNFVATNGFAKVAPGDRTFLNRQDLIKAAQKNIAGLTLNNLTNLTTFTREKNAPSWGPTQNAVDLGGTTSYPYKDNRNSATAANRLIPAVRYSTAGTITSYHVDGSSFTYPVKAGEPLVQRRFPLGRLNWIGPNGPQNGGTAESIQACFGLAWLPTVDAVSIASNPGKSVNVWKYVGPTGAIEQKTIKTLGDIAAETTPREPNFFELLQAGILSGSLGTELHRSVGGASNTFNYWTDPEMSTTLNVFRIGASILSQYDATDCPIVVEFLSPAGKPWQACGIDNLPYLNLFTCVAGADSDSPTDNIASYLLFGLWNPHQAPQGSSQSRPSIRLRAKGQISISNNFGRHRKTVSPFPSRSSYMLGTMPTLPYSCQVTLDTALPLTAAAADGYVDPHALLPTEVDLNGQPPSAAGGMMWTALPKLGGATGTSYAGYRLPNFPIDPTDNGAQDTTNDGPTILPTNLWGWFWFSANTDMDGPTPFNCWLEYKTPGNVWMPYNFHANINDSDFWFSKRPGFIAGTLRISTTDGTPTINPLDPLDNSQSFGRAPWLICDPRSLRFNYSQSTTTQGVPTWTNFLNSSVWSIGTEPARQALGMAGSQVMQKYFVTSFNPATLSRNNTAPPGTTTSQAAYVDTDGVQRIGDSGLFSAVSPASNGWLGDPYAASANRTAERPVVLNRPFYSVADLGYIPRDYPWRTLDFYTAKSGDAGLLDLFTVGETDSAVVAGTVSLNSKNPAVLQAVMAGTTGNVVDGTAVSRPTTLAADLVKLTGTTPLVGRDEIATKFVANLTATDFANTDEQNVKTRREGVTRALADVGQTRTWNLMIDVVAQSGRYAPTATSLSDFVVEGERRYWLHVAIDRFTGEVIDSQLEAVSQ